MDSDLPGDSCGIGCCFNKLSPNMLLYGKVLEYACEQGFQLFDFGRSSPDSGTYRFMSSGGPSPSAPIGTTG